MKRLPWPDRIIFSTAAALVPVLAACLLAWKCLPGHGGSGPYPTLLPFKAGTAQHLVRVLDAFDFHWLPDRQKVPALGLVHFPPEMNRLSPRAKKSAFFRALLPLVIAANNRVRAERREIAKLLEAADRTGHWSRRLKKLAARYEVRPDKQPTTADARLLMRRCNVVPIGLVLAQAAKESGWGESRFALLGNNLFGIHTWDTDAGIAAGGASISSDDRIRAYPDLMASVEGYVHNLNVGHDYVKFRKLRARELSHHRLNSVALAGTLGSYSQLGEVYIRHLQQLIQQNNLDSLPELGLRAPIP